VLPALVGTALVALDAGMLADWHRFPGKRSLLLHCALPALLGAGLWAALLLRPALSGRLTALCASAVLALFAAEAVIRALIPPDMADVFERRRRAHAAGLRDFDARSQFGVASDLRRAGTRAFPALSPATFMEPDGGGRWRSVVRVDGREVVPLSGVARAHTLLGNESGLQPAYTADEMGVHNPPGLWDGAPVDVLLLGDSFVLGWALLSDEGIAPTVRARFPRTVSLGLTGLGPLAELGQLREYGPALRPRVTVLFFYEGNDMNDLGRENASLLAGYLDPGFGQGLLARRAEVDRALAAASDEQIERFDSLPAQAWQVLQLKRLRVLSGVSLPPHEEARPPEWPLLARVLGEARAATAAWGGELRLVFLPKWSRFARAEPLGPLDRARALVLDAARGAGIDVLDAVDVIGGSGDPLDAFFYRMHGHYSPHGANLVGAAVVARLTGSQALP
jgi:hypothetical protein